MVAAGWCACFPSRWRCRWRQRLTELEQDGPTCRKPGSPSCSSAQHGALAPAAGQPPAPRRQRAGLLETSTGGFVNGGGDVPAGLLKKAPQAVAND